MAAFLDNCRFVPTAGSTTDWVFATAVGGSQAPAAAGAVDTRKYKFLAISSDLTQWEITEGAYTASTGTFARTNVLYNSSGTGSATGQTGAGTKINFTTTPNVAIIGVKEDLISIEEANSFTAAQQKQARANIGTNIGIPDVIVEEQQASTTGGGNSSTGSFLTRVLNTLVRNNGSLASLSGNQVTLPAGTYFIAWSAPAYASDHHQTRLQNVTDGTTAGVGTSEFCLSTGNVMNRSSGSAVVTIAGSKAFAIQHRFGTGQTLGLGPPGGLGVNEVYSRMEITALS